MQSSFWKTFSLAIACVMDWMVHRVSHLWTVMGFYQIYHAITYQWRGAGARSDFNQIYFLPNLVCTIWQRYSFVHIESVNHWKLGHNIFLVKIYAAKHVHFALVPVQFHDDTLYTYFSSCWQNGIPPFLTQWTFWVILANCFPEDDKTRGSVGWACVAHLSFCFEET
jgi:hypothetical protein